jgi:hypothetical protein
MENDMTKSTKKTTTHTDVYGTLTEIDGNSAVIKVTKRKQLADNVGQFLSEGWLMDGIKDTDSLVTRDGDYKIIVHMSNRESWE